MKQDKELLFYRMLSAAGLAAIAFLALTTVYSSDDYAYSLYFDNGILGYLPMAKDHYEQVNGRALVHLFAHMLLEFNNLVFCLVCVGCTLAVLLLSEKHWALNRRGRERGMCIYLLLFAAMPCAIMTQGVMWVSAFCNYVIPCVMVCSLITLALNSASGRWKRWCMPVLAFLCGATTEQMGAAALAVLALLMLWEFRVGKRNPWPALGNLFAAAAGYATIFLSPSTQGRLLRETKVSVPDAFLTSLLDGFRRQTVLLSGTPATALVVFLIFLSLGWCMFHKRRWTAIPSVLGAAAVWCGYFGTGAVREAGWALVYVLLALMGLLLIWDRMEMPGFLMVAAVVSACIMMPTQSNRSRCFLPLYLFLTAAAALLAARATQHVKGRWILPALSALLVFSAMSCYPTLAGYWHNYQIDRINAAHVSQAENAQVLYYCMDYDKRYTDSKPYDSGGAYEDYYLQSVGMDPDSVQVLYYAEDCPAVYYAQTRLRFPAYERSGHYYLPLRSVVEAAGGTVVLEQGKLRVTLGDWSCEMDYILRGNTTVVWDGGIAQYACDNGVAGFYLEESFYSSLLGLTLDWSSDDAEVRIHMP